MAQPVQDLRLFAKAVNHTRIVRMQSLFHRNMRLQLLVERAIHCAKATASQGFFNTVPLLQSVAGLEHYATSIIAACWASEDKRTERLAEDGNINGLKTGRFIQRIQRIQQIITARISFIQCNKS
jgi:hypothetical protein